MNYPKENTEGLLAFGTLEKVNNIRSTDRWRPVPVEKLEYFISQGSLCDISKELRKNIVYNLQYLEYIELQLRELKLHNIILTLLYKNFIIIGVSIVEGIFYHLLKSTGNWKQMEWELVNIVRGNDYKQNEEKYKIENYIYRKIVPKDDEMTLDSMIKKIESKKLIDIPHAEFPYLKRLKKLRNRVHLQINEHPNDTDWYSFNQEDYLWMKYTLYKILTDSKFENSAETVSFLKLSEEELEKLIADEKNI